MSRTGKSLVLLHGELSSPPLSTAARKEAGFLLRELQEGESLGMPQSRPMPVIGPRCHELRISDETVRWRIVYRIDPDAILVLDVFKKSTRKTPYGVIDACQKRLRVYDDE
ncbi:MAG: type II toxin-antitoxin system RelE/ParE family toxin [Elusimicrobiota bacterium]|nr:type II toxin-antitoxin system RelE/ParE family toxin [Elusimicrobiota bacterium]